MKAFMVFLVAMVIALAGVSSYLWCQMKRNAENAEYWAARAGNAEGRAAVIKESRDELMAILQTGLSSDGLVMNASFINMALNNLLALGEEDASRQQ